MDQLKLKKQTEFWRCQNWVGKYCVTCLELQIKYWSRCKLWPMSFTCIPYCTLGMSSYQACLHRGSKRTLNRFLGWARRQETFSSYYQLQSQLYSWYYPPDKDDTNKRIQYPSTVPWHTSNQWRSNTTSLLLSGPTLSWFCRGWNRCNSYRDSIQMFQDACTCMQS